jgi:hypothetical protein
VVGQRRVMIGIVQRVGVHQRGREPGHRVDQRMFGSDRDVVGLDDRAARIDTDLALGPEHAADPAQPHLPDVQHAGSGAQDRLDPLGQGRVHAVHEPAADLAGRLPSHRQDRHRDEQAHDRVGPGPADRHSARSNKHGQRGITVGAGVQAVGDQSGGADPAPGPDAVAGHHLVACEPERSRDRDRDQVGHRVRVQQPADRGERRGGGGQQDHRDDDDARQILGPPVSIGVPAGGTPPSEHERDAERHRGQRVGRVMQRVAEQRDRAGQGDHHRLRACRRAEPGQRDPQRPHSFGRAIQDLVQPAVVRVRLQSGCVPDTRPQSLAPVLVVMPVVMPVVMFVLVIVLVLVAGRVLLVPHLPRMTRKMPCSTSTPAIVALLQKPRRSKPLQRGPPADGARQRMGPASG